jgi:DUF4097 and DUF4098 domain-containing protein YvlB
MTKKQFFAELNQNLNQVPSEVCKDILNDIEEHFSVGLAEGLSEEEICRNLGQPGSIAEQVRQEYSNGEAEAHHCEKVRGGYEISINKTFSGVENIDVDLCEADILFVPSTDNIVRVRIDGRSRSDKFTVENYNGTLVVKSKHPIFTFNLFWNSRKLEAEIAVPAQFAGAVKANSSAGNIIVKDVGGNLSLTTAAGNIKAELDCAEKISLTTAAGNAKLVANEVGKLKLTSAAGNVKATLTKAGETKLTSSAGNVKLTANEVAGNINISTSAGTATAYLPRDANCRIDAKKPSAGSLKNELASNPNSPFTLKARTSAGSVKLLAL